jgi:hypothetical protein
MKENNLVQGIVTVADFGYPVSALWVSSTQRLLYYLAFHFFDMPNEGYSRNY